VIPPQTKIARSPRVVYRELSADEGGVLLHLESGQYHKLNRMGSTIWQLIDGERTVADLEQEIRNLTADSPVSLMEDIQKFLEGLLARELIEAAES